MPLPLHSTEYALAAIDDGDFEKLVLRYIADNHPELSGMAMMGLNEDGKPIPCPVDGVNFIPASPSSPPVVVFVASTTTARDDLRGKWLRETGKEGDVPKAIIQYTDWKFQMPAVEGQIFLATNRMLGGDANLYREVVAKLTAEGMRPRVIEASALLRYLDHTSAGQKTRQDLLGIPATDVSLLLLKELSSASLDVYWNTYGPSTGGKMIDRSAMVDLRPIAQVSAGPVGIVGQSGFGKTILTYQFAREWLASGRPVIWIPADDVIEGAPLETTLSTVLRKLQPELSPSAGKEALKITADPMSALLLLVDDVNRTASPTKTLRTIETWFSQGTNGDLRKSETNGVTVIVPLWTETIALSAALFGVKRLPRAGTNQRDKDEAPHLWHYIHVGTYSPEERTKLMNSGSDDRSSAGSPAMEMPAAQTASLRQIIDLFDGDPFLCGLISSEVAITPSSRRSETLRQVTEALLNRTYSRTVEQARSANVLTTPSEVGGALDQLLDVALDGDAPEPDMIDVRSHLGDRKADLIHYLARTNSLGWIADSPERSVWRWKHTRLRDILLGRRLAVRLFQTWNGEAELPQDLVALLQNDGLAQPWALSLVFAPGDEKQNALLRLLTSKAPLALGHVLRLALFPTETTQRDSLRSGLKHILATSTDRSGEFTKGLGTLILEQLLLTDDLLVIDVTDGLTRDWDIEFARLRNGDEEAAIRVLASMQTRREFVPGSNFSQLENTLACCARFYAEDEMRKQEFVIRMQDRLQKDTHVECVVAVLGYIGWTEFAPLIADSWNRHLTIFEQSGSRGEGTGIWLHHLWALGRCCTPETKSTLSDMLADVVRLDNTRVQHSAGKRFHRFVQPMGKGFGLRHSITPAAAEAWTETAVRVKDMAHDLFYACRHLEYPNVVESYVRWAAVAKPQFWGEYARSKDVLSDPQPVPEDQYREATVYKSKDVLERLWQMVQEEVNPAIRDLAFTIWKRSAGIDDLPRLCA